MSDKPSPERKKPQDEVERRGRYVVEGQETLVRDSAD